MLGLICLNWTQTQTTFLYSLAEWKYVAHRPKNTFITARITKGMAHFSECHKHSWCTIRIESCQSNKIGLKQASAAAIKYFHAMNFAGSAWGGTVMHVLYVPQNKEVRSKTRLKSKISNFRKQWLVSALPILCFCVLLCVLYYVCGGRNDDLLHFKEKSSAI